MVALGVVHGCSRGVCVVAPGGRVRGCSWGACVVTPGGHAWLLLGGMRGCSRGGRRGIWRDTEIRSMSGRVRILLECILVSSKTGRTVFTEVRWMCAIWNKPFQDLLSFVELVIPRHLNGNRFITRRNHHCSSSTQAISLPHMKKQATDSIKSWQWYSRTFQDLLTQNLLAQSKYKQDTWGNHYHVSRYITKPLTSVNTARVLLARQSVYSNKAQGSLPPPKKNSHHHSLHVQDVTVKCAIHHQYDSFTSRYITAIWLRRQRSNLSLSLTDSLVTTDNVKSSPCKCSPNKVRIKNRLTLGDDFGAVVSLLYLWPGVSFTAYTWRIWKKT